MRSFFVGYIEEACPGLRTNGSPEHMQLLIDNARSISAHNERVLGALPTEDDWPPLSRTMFGWSPSDASMINYRTRPIHFAASLKEVDWDLRDWLDKFEALLKQMYWEKAYVQFDAAYIGEHQFTWHPTRDWVERLTSGTLEPITTWTFESTMDSNDLDRLRNGAR
jgi:hypothetical protein